MSELITNEFWETLHDSYWGQYARECEMGGGKPSFSDFMVWSEEKGLVPDEL
jgi:hypothetical protein